jgi:DNA topoisomerase-1
MSYKLVIVESPAKCEKIEGYLGSEYKCIASFGHLQELKSLKDIDINNNFQPRFTPIESKRKQIDYIRSKILNAKEVILATDDDREGEAISWHICNLFNLSIATTKRIIFHEITKPALMHSITNPTTLNMNIVNSQFGRQILDIIVGYKITPILWEKISRTKKLSAGRCQTIALRVVYDCQNEINNSKGVKTYNTTGYFSDKNIPFALNHNFEDEKQLIAFLEDSKTHQHSLLIEKPKDSIRRPPLPFNTSTLQQAASNEYHYSPKVTMQLCQKLYESGYITYMRTETKKYSNDFIKLTTDFITNSYGIKYVNSNINSIKMDQVNNTTTQPHEAIRPTNISLTSESIDLNKQEKQMYNLIWKNTIESCMSDALFKTLLVKITAPQKYEYSYCCESIIFLGWKIIAYNNNKNSAIDPVKTMAYEYLPKITNKILPYKKIVSKLTLKAIKSHYSEACLINILEEKGIGRPSTFSSLIEKIQNRGYVKLENITGQTITCKDYYLETNTISQIQEDRQFGNEKNKLVIQPTGVLVIELLLKLYPTLFDYEYTKNMESNLDIIAHGNKNYWELCLECLREINHLNNLNNLNTPKQAKSAVKSEDIVIDDAHIYMIGKYGPVIKCLTTKPPTFLSVKSNIDLTKLKNQEYKLEDIIEKNVVVNKILGQYNGSDIVLKKGKFGLYISWDKNKKSLNNINIEESKIVLDDVIKLIENNKSSNENILREISKEISIRKGKGTYGDYIFYKTSKMIKPKFIKLNKFKEDYLTCPSSNIIKYIEK